MHNAFSRRALSAALALLAGTAAAGGLALPASAATLHAPGRVYVSTRGTFRWKDAGCSSASFRSIGAAVSAVAPGGTVIVCGGSYHETVSIAKPLTLLGESGATINATDRDNGILVTASRVRISGLTVDGAIGEGILAKSVRDVAITHNVVKDNDRGAVPGATIGKGYAECVPAGGTPADCGEGLHLEGTSFSTVADNVVTDNSGGIQLSDETGPAAHNWIAGNVVTNNVYDCGITVVGHNPAAAPNGVPAPRVAGVYDNVVSGNTISGNGVKGAGSGVVLATGLPGGAVYDNTVERNRIAGNGQSGVTLHSHVDGQYLSGNVVQDNVIGTNNLDGDPDFAPHVDEQTTGILAATVAPLTITIRGNIVSDDHFGIWTTGPVKASIGRNTFVKVAVDVAKG